MPHATGNASDSYRLVRRLMPGSTGDVFEATHPRLPGRYAIKILNRAWVGRPEVLSAYRADVEATMGLRHPNIVQLIEFSEMRDGTPFLVMEFCEGHDLEQRLAEPGPMPVGEAVSIVRAIAAGLQAAHGRGVVHRELGPRSVFLAYAEGHEVGMPKLLDFGAWRLRAAAGPAGLPTADVNRIRAPEQVSGHGDEVDARTDQFALAALAYRMLSGISPFRGDDTMAVLYQVVHETPPPLMDIVHCDPSLDAVVRQGLSKNKEGRFESAQAFARALEQAASVERRAAPTMLGRPAPRPAPAALAVAGRGADARPFVDDGFVSEGGMGGDVSFGSERELDGDDSDIKVPRVWWKTPALVLGFGAAAAGALVGPGWRPQEIWRAARAVQAQRVPAAAPLPGSWVPAAGRTAAVTAAVQVPPVPAASLEPAVAAAPVAPGRLGAEVPPTPAAAPAETPAAPAETAARAPAVVADEARPHHATAGRSRSARRAPTGPAPLRGYIWSESEQRLVPVRPGALP